MSISDPFQQKPQEGKKSIEERLNDFKRLFEDVSVYNEETTSEELTLKMDPTYKKDLIPKLNSFYKHIEKPLSDFGFGLVKEDESKTKIEFPHKIKNLTEDDLSKVNIFIDNPKVFISFLNELSKDNVKKNLGNLYFIIEEIRKQIQYKELAEDEYIQLFSGLSKIIEVYEKIDNNGDLGLKKQTIPLKIYLNASRKSYFNQITDMEEKRLICVDERKELGRIYDYAFDRNDLIHKHLCKLKEEDFIDLKEKFSKRWKEFLNSIKELEKIAKESKKEGDTLHNYDELVNLRKTVIENFLKNIDKNIIWLKNKTEIGNGDYPYVSDIFKEFEYYKSQTEYLLNEESSV